MVVDTAGRIGIETTTPAAASSFSMLTVEGGTGQYGQITAISHSPTGSPSEIPGVH